VQQTAAVNAIASYVSGYLGMKPWNRYTSIPLLQTLPDRDDLHGVKRQFAERENKK